MNICNMRGKLFPFDQYLDKFHHMKDHFLLVMSTNNLNVYEIMSQIREKIII